MSIGSAPILLGWLVGRPGFEPAASCSQSRRSARLIYAPKANWSASSPHAYRTAGSILRRESQPIAALYRQSLELPSRLGSPVDVPFRRRPLPSSVRPGRSFVSEVQREQGRAEERHPPVSLDALMRRPLSARTLRVLVGGLAARRTPHRWHLRSLTHLAPGLRAARAHPGRAVGLRHRPLAAPMIVLVVLSPILDRYVVAGLLPSGLATITNNLSEALLLGVGLILAVQAWREGRLVEAVRYPSTVAFMAFIAVAAVSAVLNGVPAHISAIGLIFTIDAAACFYLPRLVGFSLRDARAAIGAIVAVIAVAAVVAVAQAFALSLLCSASSRGGAVRRGVSACIDLRRSKRVRRLPDRSGAVPAAGGDQALAAPPAVGCRGDRLHPHARSLAQASREARGWRSSSVAGRSSPSSIAERSHWASRSSS